MITIAYMVHGATDRNKNGQFSGQVNVPLNSDTGMRESLGLKAKVEGYGKKIQKVFTSGLVRGNETADIVFGEGNYEKDLNLREINFGSLDGKKKSEYPPFTEFLEEGFTQYGGETFEQLQYRISQFIQRLQREYVGQDVVIGVIAHQCTQFAFEVLLEGKSWEKAIADDWRKKENGWKGIWEYRIEN